MIAHNTNDCDHSGPYAACRNCGNTASMNRYAFGFIRQVSAPRRNVVHADIAQASAWRPNAEFARSNEMPIHAMYNAPTSSNALKAMGTTFSNTPMPSVVITTMQTPP